MLSFSRKADYGLLLLTVLAHLPNERYVSIRTIAKRHKLPLTFLAKIASELKDIGVVSSKEGVGGGYKLSLSPRDVSLGEVVQKLDGPIAPVACMKGAPCACQSSCSHQKVVAEISQVVQKTMADYSLADLIGA